VSRLRLEDRSCLIVGGTGGIGQASARRFLDEGARVVIVGISPGIAPHDLTSLGPPDRIMQIEADASDPLEVATVFTESLRFLGGRIDGLLHVAGLSGRRYGDGPLHDCTDEGWERVMATNARSVFLSNREAVRIMRAQEMDGNGLRGTIVNVGSVLAESPSPHFFGTIAYAASKGAVRSLTLSCAAKYAPERIRFNLVEPGLIDTPMASRAANDPAIRTFLSTKQPMSGGPGKAEDVAEAALSLIEPASRFVTGAVLHVDGGWRLSEGQIAKDEAT
jgi:NAD(P)-dependent dehydrogenase (short-subunit alcohol dehydrogenase family)